MPTLTKFQIVAEKKYREIFTEDLMDFLLALHENFNHRRLMLLHEREEVQKEFDKGVFPKFLDETKAIREQDWVCAPIPEEIKDRRVEITGPVDRKMIINALNSGANCFMADFEDSNAPTWENCMHGQINLYDAVRKDIGFVADNGKEYKLNDEVATLFVRPRGLHLEEKNIVINDERASASLIDFGIYFFLNAEELLARGSRPYFYLPKLENYKEARWWNDVFVFAQNFLGIPQGTIKVTVLIETITASFQLDEILFELKEHSKGLNCGRWDYIFSYIKKFRHHSNFRVPDRDQVTMTSPFMDAYSKRVIQVCHRRGVFAIGGMAAQIPVKDNKAKNQLALLKVQNDKEREVKNGHDGTWVAHPALVPVAKEVFDAYMKTPNQIHKQLPDLHIAEEDLLQQPEGTITEEGVRKNINVGILYIESWLMGVGAAALYNLMEDAATAEISRTQVWHWLNQGIELDDGRKLSPTCILNWEEEELQKIKVYVGEERYARGRFKEAVNLFNELVLNDRFEEFLTTKAYDLI